MEPQIQVVTASSDQKKKQQAQSTNWEHELHSQIVTTKETSDHFGNGCCIVLKWNVGGKDWRMNAGRKEGRKEGWK